MIRHGLLAGLMVSVIALAGCQSDGSPEARKQALRQPERGLVTATLASAAERSGDLVAAQRFYGQLIAAGHASAQIYERRGEILLALGLPQEASAVFADALKAGFATPVIRRGYGRSLAWLARPDEALPQYDAALVANPADVRSMNGRGVSLDMLGQHDAAQAQYRAAMALAPHDLSVRNNLAMSYALAGRVDEAVGILEAIYQGGSSSVQHRQNLALLYGLLGKTEKAQVLARQDLAPDDVARNMSTYATMQTLYDASAPAVARSPAPASPAPASPAPEVVAPPLDEPAAPASPQPAKSTASVEPSPSPTPVPPVSQAGAAPAAPAEPRPVPVRQPWVIDLGLFETDLRAREVWQKLKQDRSQFAQTVHYLEPEGAGRRLLAGPFWGEEAARAACTAVRGQGIGCDPRHASAVRSGSAAPAQVSEGQQR